MVIADLSLDAAQRAAGALAGSKLAIPVRMNVVDEDQVNATVKQTVATFGRIDVLVSNARCHTSSARNSASLTGVGQLQSCFAHEFGAVVDDTFAHPRE